MHSFAISFICFSVIVNLLIYRSSLCIMRFPGGSGVKVSACNAGDLGSIPGLGRSPGEGNGNSLQYSCLGNSWTEEPVSLQSMRSQRVEHN